MAFNPIENFMQGQQAGQAAQVNNLQNALSGQVGQAGFDPLGNEQFMQLSALDPNRARGILANFEALDGRRKTSFFTAARDASKFLENGDIEGFYNFSSNRLSEIEKNNGDPGDTKAIIDMVNSGDVQGAYANLKSVEQQGIERGYLKDMNNTGVKSKLGTYNPGDYTVKSWSEFAKYGDPSILERYESDSKNRQMEIRESAQQLKEEKFALEKQSAELAKNKKEIEIAAKRKDEERAKFLELQDSKTAVSNIKSLLDNDLDLIYGGMEWVLPDKIRTQRGKNMMARRNQVVSSLKLMAAGKLKGQGSITENERTMLAQAATTLQDENIDSNLAREELNRIMPIYDFFITGEKGTVSAPQQEQQAGQTGQLNQVIKFDAQGNKIP